MPYQPLADGAQINNEFGNLDAYIGAGIATNLNAAKFCNALGRVGPAQAQSDGEAFPWLTLVLGSETLAPTLRYPPAKVARRVGELFGALAAENTDDELTEYDRRSVELFILYLCNSRVGSEVIADEDDTADASTLTYPKWQLRLFHAAATLNATYFFTKAVHAAPVNRWEDEPVTLSVPGGARARKDDYLHKRWDQAEEAVRKLGRQVPRSTSDWIKGSAISNLCSRIQERLGCEQIGADDLLALTEVAWYFLAQQLVAGESEAGASGAEGYLTWTDLLIPVGFQQEERRPARNRPSLTSPVRARNTIRRELQGTSGRRAKVYADLDSGELNDPRLEAYKLYSDILWAEAVIHEKSETSPALPTPPVDPFAGDDELVAVSGRPGSGSRNSPPAAAFVTTFDVELELAMRTYHPETPLLVVLPMTLLHSQSQPSRASTLWMGYLIEAGHTPDPDELLQSIIQPDADKWFLFLTEGKGDWSTTNERVEEVRGRAATIIRLTGSPMVEFPLIGSRTTPEASREILKLAALINEHLNEIGRIEAELSVQAIDVPEFDPKDYQERLLPATVLEEHHALQLSFPGLEDARRGLPLAYTDWAPNGYWRFWAILGVQASNEAIRYRLIAQLTGGRRSIAPSATQPKRSGVAINSGRLSSRAIDLLEWSEFDVVTEATNTETTSAALRHYLRHLVVDGRPTYPVDTTGWKQDKRCRLDEEGE